MNSRGLFVRGVWADFGPELRYSYKTFVHPRHRGKRIAQALHAFVDASRDPLSPSPRAASPQARGS